jgi:hypothetical protein
MQPHSDVSARLLLDYAPPNLPEAAEHVGELTKLLRVSQFHSMLWLEQTVAHLIAASETRKGVND